MDDQNTARNVTRINGNTNTNTNNNSNSNSNANTNSKKRKIAIGALVVGLLVLATGLSLFLSRQLSAPALDDANYLVNIGSWQRTDAPDVIWDFTAIGTGTLTTNDHVNDYDFAWALEDGQLKIDTDWLYTLSDAYTYHLDQDAKELTIETDDETLVFVPEKSTDG